jgi:hypothetical protein
VHDDVEPGVVGQVGLVDRGQPVEVGEAELVAGGGEGVDPDGRRQVDGVLPVRRLDPRLLAVPPGDLLGWCHASPTGTDVMGPRGACGR